VYSPLTWPQHQNKKVWEELIAYFPWYDMDCIQNVVSKNSFIVVCVFITVITFFKSCYLAKIKGFLPIHCLAMIGRYTYRHRPMGRIYKVCRWDGLNAMTYSYIPSFINIGSAIQKLIGGIHRHTDTQTQRQHGDRINLLSFLFHNKASRLKIIWYNMKISSIHDFIPHYMFWLFSQP
jgi:hypothetical protein